MIDDGRERDFRPFPAGGVTGLGAAALRDVARARGLLLPLLDEVGAVLLQHAGDADVELKPDGTPVTPYDRATDERLTSALTAAFPSHGTLTEEAGHIAPASDWTWVIDPIDGTSNFIAGVPYWCVSVALCLEGAPVLGVIDAPVLGLRMVATAGHGAHDDRGALRVRTPVGLRDRRTDHVPAMYSGGAARRMRAGGALLNARLMGAAALDLAFVARGVAPLAVSMAPHVWDVAAAGLLVVEAGGTFVLAGPDRMLPLEVGRDYGAITALTVASCDATTAHEAARMASES
jgi:myo-inositol-1(or 4)-monophosphatase